MFLTKNPFSDHGPNKKVLSEAFKYHIPEDIPANERTAFHGAAAAAAKAGKKNFNFGGKTHPVTMKKIQQKPYLPKQKYKRYQKEPQQTILVRLQEMHTLKVETKVLLMQ